MNAQDLVSALYKQGATLAVEDGALLIDAPDGALDDVGSAFRP